MFRTFELTCPSNHALPHHVFRETRRQSVTLMSRKAKFCFARNQRLLFHVVSPLHCLLRITHCTKRGPLVSSPSLLPPLVAYARPPARRPRLQTLMEGEGSPKTGECHLFLSGTYVNRMSGRPCYGQLTAVKTRYPQTSTT